MKIKRLTDIRKELADKSSIKPFTPEQMEDARKRIDDKMERFQRE